jgi:hypothetical protein
MLDVRYIVDEAGHRTAVLLNPADSEKLLDARDELDAIRAYDAAKASGDEAIPCDRAVAAIERERR